MEGWLAAGASVEVAGSSIPNGRQMLGAQTVVTHRLRAWAARSRLARGLGYALPLVWLCLRRRANFDVAYCRGLGDGAIVLAALRALGLCPWRLVVVPINARGTGDAHFIRSIPGWRILCRLLNSEIAGINLINTAVEADLDELGITRPPRSRIPNGIEIKPAPVRTSVAPVRRLVWTGRMEPQKGLDILLPALAQCYAFGRRFQLTLWGDGSEAARLLQSSSTLRINECIHFAGVCAPDYVRTVLIDADVFILPSRYEGMSNSVLEAMEASLPALTARCGGIDAYVDQGAGWTCAPEDQQALVRALERMFDCTDDELLAVGRRARDLAEQHFERDRIARENLLWMTTAGNASETVG